MQLGSLGMLPICYDINNQPAARQLSKVLSRIGQIKV